ncbi:hypothetical protein IWZ01DRAFT_487025 [Phyllosticta capitalensis]
MAAARSLTICKPPILRTPAELSLLILKKVVAVSKHDLIAVSSTCHDLRDVAEELVFEQIELLSGTAHGTSCAKIAQGRPNVVDSQVRRVFSSWPQSFLRFTKSLVIHDFYLIESAPIPAWLPEGIGRMLLKPKQLESLELDFHHSIVEGPSFLSRQATARLLRLLWPCRRIRPSLCARIMTAPGLAKVRLLRLPRTCGRFLSTPMQITDHGFPPRGVHVDCVVMALLYILATNEKAHDLSLRNMRELYPFYRVDGVPNSAIPGLSAIVREAMEVDAFSFYPPKLTLETRPYFAAEQVQMFAKGLAEEMTPNGVEY